MKPYRKYDPEKAPLKVGKQTYLNELADISTKEKREKAKAAFDKAWETRNFEIELYWKRTNYFWAFQIPVFAAYFTLISASAPNLPQVVIYLICCIGIIISLAWKLINVGSKDWQRHWEHHIDQLEDNFTGPLYKTISKTKTFSVSKINELVSSFFTLIWIGLALFYIIDFELFVLSASKSFAYKELIITLVTLFVVWQMVCQHGLGLFQKKTISFYRRITDIED